MIGSVDANNGLTQYTYVNGPHLLEDLIDPRGVRVSRNEYDIDGRLIATIDADGNRIELDHDIEGRTETITDRNGHRTVYVYSDRGDVLAESLQVCCSHVRKSFLDSADSDFSPQIIKFTCPS